MLNRTFTGFPILTTERLTLRQLVINDEAQIFSLRSDSEVNKYLGRQLANSIDDARKFINRINENVGKYDSLYWAITFSDKDILVGTICLFNFSDDNDKCEIGYELLTSFQGKGIMKEVLEVVIVYAFNIIRVKEIEASFDRDNHSSAKLLEKFAFRNSNRSDESAPSLLYYHLKNPMDNIQ